MKRRKVMLGLLSVLLLTVTAWTLFAQVQKRRTSNNLRSSRALVEATSRLDEKIETVKLTAANYTMSGPYSHRNLTIYLIHGEDRMTGKVPLTLQEAMAQKKVVVHETGSVNQLTIENRSDEDVYVQSGDIVKGGKQDRVLSMDLIVSPKSGRLPIESFCVEQGRWTKRGSEEVAAFHASANTVNSKELKIAAKKSRSQGEVWDKVAKSQVKVSAGVVAMGGMPGGVGGSGGSEDSQGAGQVTNAGRGLIGGLVAPAPMLASSVSPSSLQLTLENKQLRESATDYLKHLSPIIEGKKDVIGYVFAINGQLNSADVYASSGLFKKLWPRLLEASTTEAIAEYKADASAAPVTSESVKSFLNEAQAGDGEARHITRRVQMVKRETDRNLFFETRDKNRSDAWVHRNYITK